jgi:hypothetical protein
VAIDLLNPAKRKFPASFRYESPICWPIQAIASSRKWISLAAPDRLPLAVGGFGKRSDCLLRLGVDPKTLWVEGEGSSSQALRAGIKRLIGPPIQVVASATSSLGNMPATLCGFNRPS